MFQSFGQLFISARAVPIGMTEPESEPDSNSIVEMDTNNSTALAQTDAFSTASPDDTDACGSTNPVKKPDCENIENTGSLIINDLTAGSTAENTSNRSTYVSNVAGPSSENTTIVNHNNENSWIDNRINGYYFKLTSQKRMILNLAIHRSPNRRTNSSCEKSEYEYFYSTTSKPLEKGW